MSKRSRIFASDAPYKRRSLMFNQALFVVVPVLVLAALLLPPFSLANRLFHFDYDRITPKAGGLTSLSDLAAVEVAPGDTSGTGRFKLSVYDAQQLAELGEKTEARAVSAQLPQDVIARGGLFRLAMSGRKPTTATISLPVPGDLPAVETADFYGWNGTEWVWLPSTLSADGNKMTAVVSPVLEFYMVMQTQAQTPRVIHLGSAEEFNGEQTAEILIITGAVANEDGSLTAVPAPAAGSSRQLMSVSNQVNGVYRSDWTYNILANSETRQAHLESLLAAAEPFDGIELNYGGITSDLSPLYSAFARALAAELHATGKLLAVRLDAYPGMELSGAADWQSLGASSDYVNLNMPMDPAQLAPDSGFADALRYITSNINRRKLNLVVSAYSTDKAGEQVRRLSYSEALGILTKGIATENENAVALPSSDLTIKVPMLETQRVQLDADTQTYWFAYKDDNQVEHTVWLANAPSVSSRLRYLGQHALGGVVVEGAGNTANDGEIAQLVGSYQASVVPAQPYYTMVWTITNEQGQLVTNHITQMSEPRIVWRAPSKPGRYILTGAVSTDGGKSSRSTVVELAFNVPTLTPAPTEEAMPTATEEPTPIEEVAETPEPTEGEPTDEPEPEPELPPAPPPSGGGGFGYGIQADFMSDGNHDRIFGAVQDLGLNWVKQQIEWFRYNPAPGVYEWGAIDRLVDGANARGINVLLSVVKAPGWARPAGDTHEGPPADVGTYATFVRELAARYKGRVRAYEIWNEQNLYYEWGGLGKVNASRYIELLAAAYNAIKSVDPNAIVISGAPTPTGVTNEYSVDDRLYLEQMYQAGLAYYCDAVGVHPSGYNNPPDANFYDWSDPSAPSFKGHPSFFFKSTMEAYRNIMVAYGDGWKQLWPTEFGWATVEGLGVGPAGGYEYAGNNTEAEQAEWIKRAYQLGRSWGWVGPMFLWNLNFAPVAGAGDEKAAFGIVRADWSARPAYDAIKYMDK